MQVKMLSPSRLHRNHTPNPATIILPHSPTHLQRTAKTKRYSSLSHSPDWSTPRRLGDPTSTSRPKMFHLVQATSHNQGKVQQLLQQHASNAEDLGCQLPQTPSSICSGRTDKGDPEDGSILRLSKSTL